MATVAVKNANKVKPLSKSKIKEGKKPLSRSILKFAVEKGQPDVARVKLLLCNNSNRQMQWILKCTDSAITAKPMMSGSIEKLGRNEVDLMWQRPKAIKQWTDAPQPKMQLFMKMFATESGKEVADAFTKFKAMINPEAECTINDLPIHEMIVKSEGTFKQLAATHESDSKSGVDSVTNRPENFLENPETLFWLIVCLCCFIAAVILQSIFGGGGGRKSHR
uniref:Major sperm protein n=1 Tax=Wuchereria bancrofti TaxID=6293 RepID=A0A1I8EQV6_WUCBA